MEMAVEHNNQTRQPITFLCRLFSKVYIKTPQNKEQKQCRSSVNTRAELKVITVTLHGTHCVHTLMNVRNEIYFLNEYQRNGIYLLNIYNYHSLLSFYHII